MTVSLKWVLGIKPGPLEEQCVLLVTSASLQSKEG